MKVVFDTNVIVAGVVATGLCHELIEQHLPRHEPLLSSPLWGELVRTLVAKFDLEPVDLPFLGLYRQLATWVEPRKLSPGVCRDPADDWVLATALVGGASVIVTGDDDLLSLDAHGEVEILTPREFLERLEPWQI